MKTTSLADIAQLEDGELVMRVEGEITRVFDRKSGTKGDKDWAIQNFILKDDSGEIRVGAWNHDDISSLSGRKVSITAHKSDKGFSGVYCELNDYKGKQTKQLRLTYTAKIERLDGQQSADSSSQGGSSARPDSKRVSTPPPEHQNDSTGTVDDALGQVGNALHKVLASTKHRWEQQVVDGLVPESFEFFGSAHFQADCSIAWGYLKDRGLVDKLHAAPIWKEAKKKSVLPSQEDEF